MSDTEKPQEETQVVSTQAKKDIFIDLLILSLISGTIGLGLYFVMMPFKKVSPSDALYSTVVKGDRLSSNRDALVGSILTAVKASATKSFELEKEEKAIVDNFEKEFKQGIKTYEEMKADGDTTVAFVNAPDDNGVTPLMRICYTNLLRSDQTLSRDKSRLRFVEQMLARPETDIQIKDNQGFTALHWAAWSGFPTIAEKLIDSGLQIDQTENNGYTPLALAAMRGHNEVVAMLLKRGANKDAKTKDGESALDLVKKNAAAYSKRNSAVYALIYVKSHHDAYEKTHQLLDPSYTPAEIISADEKKQQERDDQLEAAIVPVLELAQKLEAEAKKEAEEKAKAEKK